MPNLSELLPGECAVVEEILLSGNMRRRLHDLGLSIGTKIECVSVSPMRDPKAYMIRGAVIAIRSDDSNDIIIAK